MVLSAGIFALKDKVEIWCIILQFVTLYMWWYSQIQIQNSLLTL